jgi:aminopeptidase N
VGNSLQVFENYFGPYPYGKLAVTNIPWGYGQGWPSLLYVSSITFIDSTQRHVLFGGRLSAADQLNITDRFRAHETSHQWWGHVVGWKSYRDQWLSEGFAEYSGLLYLQLRQGTPKFVEGLRLGREELFSKDANGAVYNYIGPIAAGRRLSSYDHPFGYQTIAYTKGGWVLHMLRMMMIDFQAQDADERFKAMMKDFTKTYYNQPASTRDFQRIAEKYMTGPMNLDGSGKLDWFFNQWVYGTAIPHYEVSYTLTPQGKGTKISLQVTQSNVPPTFGMLVPIYVHQGKKSMLLGRLPVQGQGNTLEYEVGFPIDKITINEWEDILCTVSYKK